MFMKQSIVEELNKQNSWFLQNKNLNISHFSEDF